MYFIVHEHKKFYLMHYVLVIAFRVSAPSIISIVQLKLKMRILNTFVKCKKIRYYKHMLCTIAGNV